VSEGGQLEVLDVDGRIILKWLLNSLFKDGYWIDLALCRDRWCAFVKAVKKICFS
jgi:hypothetical protein